MKMIWILPLIGSIIAGIVFGIGVLLSNGAPQECAVSAIALCLAILPYSFARSVSELNK